MVTHKDSSDAAVQHSDSSRVNNDGASRAAQDIWQKGALAELPQYISNRAHEQLPTLILSDDANSHHRTKAPEKSSISSDASQHKSGADVLFDSKASPEDKLRAALDMAKKGQTEFSGPDGKKYSISTDNYGKREGVSIFTENANGHPTPLLRGLVDKASGQVSHQKDRHGNDVDYAGTYAQKHMHDNPLLKAEKGGEPHLQDGDNTGNNKQGNHSDKAGEGDKTGKLDDATTKRDHESLEHESQKLRNDAGDLIKNDSDRTKFLSDLDKFEERARSQKLSDKEVSETYSQIARMIEAKDGKTPQADRILAAETLAGHLADPTNIDQGAHNTCNVTTLGERLITRNPSKAAEMVATTTLTGSWQAPDGKEIKIDDKSLIPGREEKDRNPPLDGSRSYATQIMNLVLANDTNQRRHPPMFYSQERTEDPQADSGERLKYADGREVREKDIDGTGEKPLRDPAIYASDLARMGEQITGDKGFVMVHPEADSSSDNVVRITSQAEMEKALAEARDTGKFPIILQVDANDQIFNGTGKPEDAGKWHVVSITGYDAATHKVKIDNQWGRAGDQTVDARDLFRATHTAKKST